MTHARRQSMVLVVGFLAIVFIVGGIQPAFDLSAGRRPGVFTVFTQKPNAANLRAYEKQLENESWLTTYIRPPMLTVLFLGMRDGGEKAVRGKSDWLYYKQDIAFAVQPFSASAPASPTSPSPLEAIVAFQKSLADRGIKLLVVPAPGKPSVYPEMLISTTKVTANGHTQTFIETLKANGVEAIDLLPAFDAAKRESSAPRYLAQDTHWTPDGMKIAAEAVAKHLVELNWVSPGDHPYEVKLVSLARSGDVLKMMNVPAITARFQTESLTCEQIVDPATQQPRADDPASSILGLGDSFLRIYERDEPGSAGFSSHLAHALQQPVASVINDGGASTLVRQQLARKPELLDGKRVVVWEFVERDLRFGMEGWKYVALPGQ